MKRHLFIAICTAIAVFTACSNEETKTLYGSWEPILESNDSAGTWGASDDNFLLTVSGKCEEIEVTRTERGDLTNPDVPMIGATCTGERDILTFTDSTIFPITYVLKMDASKDTLIGTASSVNSDGVPHVGKIKFLRI